MTARKPDSRQERWYVKRTLQYKVYRTILALVKLKSMLHVLLTAALRLAVRLPGIKAGGTAVAAMNTATCGHVFIWVQGFPAGR